MSQSEIYLLAKERIFFPSATVPFFTAVEGQTQEKVRIAPSRVPRFVTLTTNGMGTSVWRVHLATTANDLPLSECRYIQPVSMEGCGGI